MIKINLLPREERKRHAPINPKALLVGLGCVVIGVQGPQRVCREGPVFAADEIDWETAP